MADDERLKHPPLLDSERDVLAHIMTVLFECLQRIPGAIPEDVSVNLAHYELARFKEGHINADDFYDADTYDERQELLERLRLTTPQTPLRGGTE